MLWTATSSEATRMKPRNMECCVLSRAEELQYFTKRSMILAIFFIDLTLRI
jgi:hypothetical protein